MAGYLKDASLTSLIRNKFMDASGSDLSKVDKSKEKIEDFIGKARVAIFSKTWCPYCMRAKSLLDERGIAWQAEEIDLLPDGRAWQKYLAEREGEYSVTVPRIYINGRLVGGSDKLAAAARSGELDKLLEMEREEEQDKQDKQEDTSDAAAPSKI